MTDGGSVADRIRRERSRVLGTIDELGPRATEPGAAGAWSAKDVLAHFIAWVDLTIGVLDRHHRRARLDFPGQEELNRQAAASYAGISLAGVCHELEDATDELIDAVVRLAPGELDETGRLSFALELSLAQFVEENSYGHWPEHDAEIRAWAGLPPH